MIAIILKTSAISIFSEKQGFHLEDGQQALLNTATNYYKASNSRRLQHHSSGLK
jgi:hypothetical protein